MSGVVGVTGGWALRPHQVAAVDAAVRTLGRTPAEGVAGPGLRATIVSACGTGKTLMGVHTAQRVAHTGRVLVLVPTLDLLVQTVATWRGAGRAGRIVAVCSLRRDPELDAAGVRCTTDWRQVVGWVGQAQRATVFATYASLPVLVKAHASGLGRWDVVIVDEAHRTSGPWGKPWAAIHDNAVIPADRRLYLTATPRVAEPWAGAGEATGEPALVASMDDEQVFGPVAYRLTLAEAIDRGLLARYQIVVMEIHNQALGVGGPEEAGLEAGAARRLEGLQAAVLKAAAEHHLQRVMTFHHRVMEARDFADAVEGASRRLREADPGLYPREVWSGWLHGGHRMAHRRTVLEEFARGCRTDGQLVERSVLSSARVLAEGVDIPAVDAVVFADPRESIVDTVQTVGRALRQGPRGDKTASLLVPVFLGPDERSGDWLGSGAYLPLVRVLAALRAHDTEVVDRLAAWPGHTGSQGGDVRKEGLAVLFSHPRDPVDIAAFVNLRVIRPQSRVWLNGLMAARRFHAQHGHLVVPYVAKDGRFPLGVWMGDQRRLHHAGRLSPVRTTALEQLGMVWSHPDHTFSEGLSVARAYHTIHGHLAAPREASVDGYPLGTWLANRRREARMPAGTPGALSTARRTALEDIDPYWCPEWDVAWQRRYALLHRHVSEGGSPAVAPGHMTAGEDIGVWCARQRAAWDTLGPEQRRLLAALGMTPDTGGTPATSRVTQDDSFRRNLAAAQAYSQREGNLNIPRKHVEILDGREIRLGVWISNQRSRRTNLSPERIGALDNLGMRWS
ncbi:Helicase associated domain protein [Streptomyces sp. WAC05292]|uniref:DEAD/DEAH box helicase n=1 Tax=Streptomyces sp. WAC05292 TaxID=2487418 RepID=UPI0028A71732|nr:Helicase associated domain protein [Streptomyces sp. WAC05292]